MKFLLSFALLCVWEWRSAAAIQPVEKRVTNNNFSLNHRASRAVLFDKKSFEKEFLRAHNVYRKLHNVPRLKLNKTLSTYAEEWAEQLLSAMRSQGKIHSGLQGYGENIHTIRTSDPNFVFSARETVKKWYNEIKFYTFGSEPISSSNTGHFTQVVWEDTKEVGVGVEISDLGHEYYYNVVANYYPPGNYEGSYVQNVHPPSVSKFQRDFCDAAKEYISK